jgi:hypothetical protein
VAGDPVDHVGVSRVVDDPAQTGSAALIRIVTLRVNTFD